MKIGYARVSNIEQNLNLRRDALLAAGCERVIADTASKAVASRPGLEKVKEQLRAGDILVVWGAQVRLAGNLLALTLLLLLMLSMT